MKTKKNLEWKAVTDFMLPAPKIDLYSIYVSKSKKKKPELLFINTGTKIVPMVNLTKYEVRDIKKNLKYKIVKIKKQK